MRIVSVLALVVAAMAAPVRADDEKGDRERKVKVALALAAGETCGQCREETAGREEARRDRKPIALFVGGCERRLGCDAERAGAVPVKAATYTGDGRPPAEKRVVLLEPNADSPSGFVRAGTLPPQTPAADLKKAVQAATPKAKAAGKKLDWYN